MASFREPQRTAPPSLLCRKLDGHGPVATDTKDRPAVAGSKEKKHKALGVRETAGREGDNGDEQNKEQQETKGRAKGKNSKRVVVVAGKGNSGRKGKVSASQPPSASPPPVLQGGRRIVQLRCGITPNITVVSFFWVLSEKELNVEKRELEKFTNISHLE